MEEASVRMPRAAFPRVPSHPSGGLPCTAPGKEKKSPSSTAADRRLQTKPHIRRTPLLLPFALLIGLSACERSPVEFDAQIPPDDDARFAVTDAAAGSSEVEIDSSTYVFARTGDTDIVTFQDTDGRSYEFRARYDSSDQLIQFDLFLDGEYEGIQELRWVQGSHDETVTTSHLGDWAWSDEHHDLVMTGGEIVHLTNREDAKYCRRALAGANGDRMGGRAHL